jgi:hypothetical protein
MSAIANAATYDRLPGPEAARECAAGEGGLCTLLARRCRGAPLRAPGGCSHRPLRSLTSPAPPWHPQVVQSGRWRHGRAPHGCRRGAVSGRARARASTHTCMAAAPAACAGRSAPRACAAPAHPLHLRSPQTRAPGSSSALGCPGTCWRACGTWRTRPGAGVGRARFAVPPACAAMRLQQRRKKAARCSGRALAAEGSDPGAPSPTGPASWTGWHSTRRWI